MNISSFQDFVVAFLGARRPDLQARYAGLSADDDLFETAAVDSHTFIDLCLAIEEKTGVLVDIASLEPEDFSTIAGLHRIVSEVA